MIISRFLSNPLAVIVIIFCFLGPTISGAAEGSRTLRIIAPIFPVGWMYLENGEVGGSRREFIDKVASHAGFNLTAELLPAKRAIIKLREGHADFSMLVKNPLLDNPELILRSKDPVFTVNLNVYGMRGTPQVRSKDELKGKTVAVMRGYGYGGFINWLNDPDNNVTKIVVDSFKQVVKLLIIGRAEYGFLYDLNYEYALTVITEEENEAIANSAQNLSVTEWSRLPVYIHLSRKALPDAESVLEELMNSFNALQQKGELPLVEPRKLPGDQP